jgi:hypothetical protein
MPEYTHVSLDTLRYTMVHAGTLRDVLVHCDTLTYSHVHFILLPKRRDSMEAYTITKGVCSFYMLNSPLGA